MPTFQYRAVTAQGALEAGVAEAPSLEVLFTQLRRRQLRPIEAGAVATTAPRARRHLPRRALPKLFGELAVMLEAGIALDHAVAVQAEDAEDRRTQEVLQRVHRQIREGAPLSQALSNCEPAFPPMAMAMAAAGETHGRPAAALKRLADALERAEALRSSLVSALIYPTMLLLIALGVISLMLFWVVPQFEGLFSDARASLPPMTRIVLGVSHFARAYWLCGLVVMISVAFAIWRLLKRPDLRRWVDRTALTIPRLGLLLSMGELARFFRVLGSMVEGGVALPLALSISERSLSNSHIRAAVAQVTKGLREGGELTGPLAATGVLPRRAVSYLRTGEATAQLPMMLTRLADTLDRDVKTGVDRMVVILTPLLTVIMGAIVATVVASIMTAILGFDDLALSK